MFLISFQTSLIIIGKNLLTSLPLICINNYKEFFWNDSGWCHEQCPSLSDILEPLFMNYISLRTMPWWPTRSPLICTTAPHSSFSSVYRTPSDQQSPSQRSNQRNRPTKKKTQTQTREKKSGCFYSCWKFHDEENLNNSSSLYWW